MTWTVRWPSEPGEYLVWTQTILVWTLFNYATRGDGVGLEALQKLANAPEASRRWWTRTVRMAVLAGGLMAFLPGSTLDHLLSRSALFVVGASLLSFGPRSRLWMAASDSGSRWLAEWEIALNLTFLVLTALIIGYAGLAVMEPLIRVPWSEGQCAAVSLVASAVVFVLRGGTHIVRGVLDKSDTLPRTIPTPASRPGEDAGSGLPVDATEYNHGRIIGNVERFLMLLVIALGSYEALGFLVAAKGLIRGRELEQREFAEYFILGSLTSVCVALVVGAAVRHAATFLWNM